jgi:hypothetical protein
LQLCFADVKRRGSLFHSDGGSLTIRSVAIYEGPFGMKQATRLLLRAGFGPRKGEAEALARLGLRGAVLRLTRPKRESFVGPPPVDDKGNPLAPYDAYGHDHLWWLDRMVRTSRPLVERMTLVWHDWFATSNAMVGSQRMMLDQNKLLRRESLGSFASLFHDITIDPAMLIWLNGNQNTARAPNENYAREMMELFTLGADRGYTEQDVREQARALTGWTNDYQHGYGPVNFHFDPLRHDAGLKLIFDKSGTFDWVGSVKLCLANPKHPGWVATKLWGYFLPTPPDAETQASLAQLYAADPKLQVRPLLESILMHPDLYEGPSLVLPPVVYTAALLRRLGRGIDTTSWVGLDAAAGQQLFFPPNVAGWGNHWLDTATFLARWGLAANALKPYQLDPSKGDAAPDDPDRQLVEASRLLGSPVLRKETVAALGRFVHGTLADAGSDVNRRRQYAVMAQNTLRQLIAISPELQVA